MQLTRYGFNATLPLLRKDSKVRRIVADLWGVYTPSAGQGPLFMGSEEECYEKLSEYEPGHWRSNGGEYP
jgi:hypothetical protein